MKQLPKDNLEKYIQEHRSELDRHYPAAAVWDRISTELDKRQYVHKPVIYTIMQWAAAVVMVLAVGFVIGMYTFTPSTENQQLMANMAPDDYKRYQDINQYYTHQVSQKMNEVETLQSQQPVGDSGRIESDLQQLDAIFHELQKELLQRGGADQDRIINAMILNYQTKIEILERVAEKYKQQQQLKQQKHETVDI
jgi:hypothetical protein